MRKSLAFAIVLASATPVLGDVTAPGGKTIDCFCTDRGGARIELGESICLAVDGRMFMARCEMSQNVPMWRDTGGNCLSSDLQMSPRPGSSALEFLQSPLMPVAQAG